MRLHDLRAISAKIIYLAYAELVKPFDCIFIIQQCEAPGAHAPGYFINGHSLTIM